MDAIFGCFYWYLKKNITIYALFTYFCYTTATIGGFIAGTTLGWTAPAGPAILKNDQYTFMVTEENLAWIGAFTPLGAMLGCPVTAGLVDKLGRKNMMMMLTIPTLVGWGMIIWAESVSIHFLFFILINIYKNVPIKRLLSFEITFCPSFVISLLKLKVHVSIFIFQVKSISAFLIRSLQLDAENKIKLAPTVDHNMYKYTILMAIPSAQCKYFL